MLFLIIGSENYVDEIKKEFKDIKDIKEIGINDYVDDFKEYIKSKDSYVLYEFNFFTWATYEKYQPYIKRITFTSDPGGNVCDFFNINLDEDFFQHGARYQIDFT